MKILLIGFFVFSSWSTFATYVYVCKIKGFCGESKTQQITFIENKTIADADTFNVVRTPKQTLLPENLIIYFPFDKSEFEIDGRLIKYVNTSSDCLDQNGKSRLTIIGYADAVGTKDYNIALGYRRAQGLTDFFKSKGIAADRIIIKSKGEEDPADDNETISGRANNRRTEITIITY